MAKLGKEDIRRAALEQHAALTGLDIALRAQGDVAWIQMPRGVDVVVAGVRYNDQDHVEVRLGAGSEAKARSNADLDDAPTGMTPEEFRHGVGELMAKFLGSGPRKPEPKKAPKPGRRSRR